MDWPVKSISGQIMAWFTLTNIRSVNYLFWKPVQSDNFANTICKRCLFECGMRKYNTCPVNKVLAFTHPAQDVVLTLNQRQ